MQKTRQLAINGSGGAFTKIRTTITAFRMLIQEDKAANAGVAQGLQYQMATTVGIDVTYGATLETAEPIEIVGSAGDTNPHKEPIGSGGSSPNPVAPGGPVTTGTIILQIKSATATPTTIDITEWA
jgi:hypothetical protein